MLVTKYAYTNSFDASEVLKEFGGSFDKTKKAWILSEQDHAFLIKELKNWKENGMYAGKLRKLQNVKINKFEEEVNENKNDLNLNDLI